jgi:aspartate kinase
MIVSKFGGRATSCKKALKNIKSLSKNKDRKVLVFSAVGKQDKTDSKLTDLLITLAKQIHKNQDTKKTYFQIIYKINQLVENTKTKVDFLPYLASAVNKFKFNKDINELISKGEYITTYIMAKYLNIEFVPAEKVIHFKKGKVDEEKTKSVLDFYLKRHSQIAIPGFYGIDENKQITLLSRGGGDVTGAIITKLLNADIYENWTDVKGIKQVNPIIMHSKQIKEMNYLDLEFMTTFDAKIVHKDCAKILQDTDAVLKVGSIFSPSTTPTLVFKNCKAKNFYICYKENEDNVDIYVHKSDNQIETHTSTQEQLKPYIKEIYKKG